MQIVEVRELDGPNLFLLQPAIKLEYSIDPGEELHVSPVAADLLFSDVPDSELTASLPPAGMLALIGEIVGKLHEFCGAELPDIVSLEMETPGHFAVAFTWERRAFARALAHVAFDIAGGTMSDLEAAVEGLRDLLHAPATKADVPEMLTDAKRTIPIIAITGTNGKTTTTRLIASVLMRIGRKVGWTSSAGIMIQNEMVVKGDYTGPSGAARVFEEPGVDIAVLETARGGILLRGLGYESNDVSVITNVTADHLGLHGVHTVEGLRDVKSVVAQVTTPDGYVVLNADDPMSLSVKDRVTAKVILVSKDSQTPDLVAHLAAGGWGVYVRDSSIESAGEDGTEVITTLDQVPITFGGRAPHMVENALAATAALLASGLTVEEVRGGLAAFRNESEQNRGRLNVFRVNDGYVILDFAHNPAGLDRLLAFGRNFIEGDGRLIAVVGTAGDRTDETLREVGRIAAENANYTIFKDTAKYLRGRLPGEIMPIMHAGFEAGGGGPFEDADWERPAALRAIGMLQPNDVVALMCIEDYDFLIDHLKSIGEPYTG
jgi:cyanophycin synthetase